jgi:TonB family protein
MVRGALLLSAGILAFGGTARAADDEPAIPGEGVRATFLRNAHERIHRDWVEAFLRNTHTRLPASHPVNRRDLSVVVKVTLIPDGTAIESGIEKSSGLPEFDAAALDLFRDSTFPQPPDEALSDDGRAHLRWVFARDQRQCSGVTVVMREAPLDEALPRLLAHRQDKEALRRVRLAAVAAPEAAIGALARAWLARALEQTVQSLPAAIGLAGADDTRGVEVLREAHGRGERLVEVTAALVRLKLMVPPAQEPTAPARPAAERLSREALIQQLHNGNAAARLDAAAVLLARADAPARQALAALVRAEPELRLFGASSLERRARAALMADVGAAGKQAFRLLVRGPGRGTAGEWLISQFEALTPSAQVAVLSDWVWNSREASPITLSVR